jgi:hypothetical protein
MILARNAGRVRTPAVASYLLGVAEIIFGQHFIQDAKIELAGDFESVLAERLPEQLNAAVVHYAFTKPAPAWLMHGTSASASGPAIKQHLGLRCREFLNSGMGMQLSLFFAADRSKENWQVMEAQSASLVEYLTTGRKVAGDPHRTLIEFAIHGQGAMGWDAALKKYYATDAMQLQKEWIDWLRQQPIAPALTQPRIDPTRIPPVNFGR